VRGAQLLPMQQRGPYPLKWVRHEAGGERIMAVCEAIKTLVAWKRAHEALLLALRATHAAYHPRAKNLFDQLRRATISIEANIAEGDALNTPGLCRRHLRIAIGSAAEAETLARAAAELGYLDEDTVRPLLKVFDATLGAWHGLRRSPPVIGK